MRSPHAAARLVDVDVSRALEVDGLVAIYTYEDLEGPVAEPLPLLIPHPRLHAPRTGYPLANGAVRHVGEPVAMVVARDRYLAEDACERIAVTYEPLPPVVGLDAAVAAEQTVHDDVPDNVAARMVQEHSDARAAVAAAPTTSSSTWPSSGPPPCPWRAVASTPAGTPPTGPCASTARPRPRPRSGSPWPIKLGVPVDRVEVVATTSAAAGSRSSTLGRRCAGPLGRDPPRAREVKWAEDRREHFVAAAHERGQRHHVSVGFDDDGRLLGLDVEFLHDNGAYTPYGIIVPSSPRPSSRPLQAGRLRVEFRSLYTNTVIVTPYQGAGRPQGAFAMGGPWTPSPIWAVTGPRCGRPTSSSPTRCPMTTTSPSRTGGR